MRRILPFLSLVASIAARKDSDTSSLTTPTSSTEGTAKWEWELDWTGWYLQPIFNICIVDTYAAQKCRCDSSPPPHETLHPPAGNLYCYRSLTYPCFDIEIPTMRKHCHTWVESAEERPIFSQNEHTTIAPKYRKWRYLWRYLITVLRFKSTKHGIF